MVHFWRCTYINCRSKRVKHVPDPLHMIGVKFIKFPKPKTQPEDCLRWIAASGSNLTVNKIQSCHYICTRHFINPQGPTVDNPDPLPYDGDFKHSRNKGCIYEEKRIMEVDDNVEDVVIGKTNNDEEDEKDSNHSIHLEDTESISNINGNDDCGIIYATDFHIFPISLKEESDDETNGSKDNESGSISDTKTTVLHYPSSENLFLWEIYKEIYQLNLTDSFNWFVSKTENIVMLVKQNESTYKTEPLSVTISSTLEIKIRVYNEELPSAHPLLKHSKTQQRISCARDVVDFLHFLGTWIICSGNTEPHLLNNKNDHSGIFHPDTNAVHSRICERLYRNTTKTGVRCKRCKIFRYLFRKNLKRRKEAQKASMLAKIKKEREVEEIEKKFKDSNPLESAENFRYFFMKEQIRLQSNGLKRAQHWNIALVKWCKILNNKSHNAYKMLSQALILPTTRTLSNVPFPADSEIPWLNVTSYIPPKYQE